MNLIRIQRAVCVLVYASAGFKQCKLDRIKPRVVLELLISQTICFPFHLRHLKHAAEALIRSGIIITTTQQKRISRSLCSFISSLLMKRNLGQYSITKLSFCLCWIIMIPFINVNLFLFFCQFSLYVRGGS